MTGSLGKGEQMTEKGQGKGTFSSLFLFFSGVSAVYYNYNVLVYRLSSCFLPTVSLTAYSSRLRGQNPSGSIRKANRGLHEKLATKVCIADSIDGFPSVRDRFYSAIHPAIV